MEDIEKMVQETNESATDILDSSQSNEMSSAEETFEEGSAADLTEVETDEETTEAVIIENMPFTDNQSYLWLLIIVIIGFACISAIHRAAGFMRKMGD